MSSNASKAKKNEALSPVKKIKTKVKTKVKKRINIFSLLNFNFSLKNNVKPINKGNILEAIELFEDELSRLKKDIIDDNWDSVNDTMNHGKTLHEILD